MTIDPPARPCPWCGKPPVELGPGKLTAGFAYGCNNIQGCPVCPMPWIVCPTKHDALMAWNDMKGIE